MVSRTSGKQIIFAVAIFLAFGLLIIGIFILYQSNIKPPRYNASREDDDLAVLSGIASVEKNLTESKNVKAVVVPHHLVASKSIALGVSLFGTSSQVQVVVLSPDHYGKCPKLLCTTTGSYQTFFGDVPIDNQTVVQLSKSSQLVDISDLFQEEHGVYAIVPFIKFFMPNSKIIPIAVSQKGRGTESQRSEIIKLLEPLFKNGAVLIVSTDFSHYLPLDQAKEMDKKTEETLCAGDSDSILSLKNPSQSDCPFCLWILEQEAKNLGFWNPVILTHTNSAELLNNLAVKETTSHFTIELYSDPKMNKCHK